MLYPISCTAPFLYPRKSSEISFLCFYELQRKASGTKWVLAGIYLHKVNSRNTRLSCEISSKLSIKAPERRHMRRSGVFIVSVKDIWHLALVFLLLTLYMQLPAGVGRCISMECNLTRSAIIVLQVLLFTWWCLFKVSFSRSKSLLSN